MNRLVVPALLTSLLACGSPPSGATPQLGSSGGTQAAQAEIASHAVEPRSTDVTAAAPASTTEPAPKQSPSRFANIGMTGASAAPAKDPRASDSAVPTKISARHVLIQWMGAEKADASVVRSKDQAFTLAKEVLRRAKAGDDFARLAVEYSDEPNAGARGGSVGRFGHGQMVPEFDAAAFKLKVGEISGIVETPFGYHVIQRTE